MTLSLSRVRKAQCRPARRRASFHFNRSRHLFTIASLAPPLPNETAGEYRFEVRAVKDPDGVYVKAPFTTKIGALLVGKFLTN
jgi:hypothetical protein